MDKTISNRHYQRLSPVLTTAGQKSSIVLQQVSGSVTPHPVREDTLQDIGGAGPVHLVQGQVVDTECVV